MSRTNEMLSRLGGSPPASPLSAMRDQILARTAAAEEHRLHEAQARQARLGGGAGPLLSVLQRKLADLHAERLENSAAPAITCADFHQMLRSAAIENPKDRGLGRAATHAYRLWSKDPQGSLAVGDLARFRAHYTAEYPRSRVAAVIDHDVPKQGFNTLPIRDLNRIASQVVRAGGTQEAYEEAVRHHGLDQQSMHAFRCRAYIRSIIDQPAEESQEPQELAQRVAHRLATDEDPLLSKYAQMLDEPEAEAEIESPITGEPLRIELEPEEEPELEPELAMESDPLPQGMEMMAQLEDFAPESTAVMSDPTDPEGGLLEVRVRSLEDAGPQPLPDDDAPPLLDDAPPLLDDGMDVDASSERCGQCGADDHDASSCEVRTAFRVVTAGRVIDRFNATGMAGALTRIAAHGVRGSVWAVPEEFARVAYINVDDEDTWLRVAAAQPDEMDSDEAFTPDINEQMPDNLSVSSDIMVGDKTMGKQHHPHAAKRVAEAVLDGQIAKRAGWELQVNGDAEVELLYRGKQKRKASLGELDEVAEVFVEKSAPPPLRYAAMRHQETGDYVIVTDVPGAKTADLKHNAKRMLSAIQKYVPAAKATLRKDAKLQVDLPKAGEAELGRVRRILEDRYRAREFMVTAQEMPLDVPNVDGSAANEGPVQPHAQSPEQLPQNTNQTPGTLQPPQPAAPQPAAPVQQDSTYVGPPQKQGARNWKVTFVTPRGETAEAPVEARTAKHARSLFLRFNDDCRVVRVAQMELEVAPGEPVGGGEEVPLPIEEQLVVVEDPQDNLSMEERSALEAALKHFRNQNLGPLSAANKILSQYQQIFERHGEPTDHSRHEIEAATMAMAAEIWTQPAVLEKEAQSTGFADMADPIMSSITLVYFDNPVKGSLKEKKSYAVDMHRKIQQVAQRLGADVHVDGNVDSLVWELQGADAKQVEQALGPDAGKFQVRKRAQKSPLGPDSETAAGSGLEAPKINTQPPVSGNPTKDTSLGKDTSTNDPGSFGADKPKAHPDQHKQPGESFADTDLGKDSETDSKINKLFDDVSAKGTDAFRSANRKLVQLNFKAPDGSNLQGVMPEAKALEVAEREYPGADIQMDGQDILVDGEVKGTVYPMPELGIGGLA